MTKIKNSASQDWVVIETTVKHRLSFLSVSISRKIEIINSL